MKKPYGGYVNWINTPEDKAVTASVIEATHAWVKSKLVTSQNVKPFLVHFLEEDGEFTCQIEVEEQKGFWTGECQDVLPIRAFNRCINRMEFFPTENSEEFEQSMEVAEVVAT